MAKTVIVEFSFFHKNVLPEGVAVGDVVSVARSYEIYQYFEAHFDPSLLQIIIEGGRVTSLFIDGEDRRSVPLDEQAFPTILAWAEALPEVRMFIRTAHGSSFDHSSDMVLKRSLLGETLPHLLAILRVEEEYGFVIAEDIRLPEVSAAKQSPADETAVVPGMLLDGAPVTEDVLKVLNQRIDKAHFIQQTVENLAAKNLHFIGDLVQQKEADILLLPTTGKKHVRDVVNGLREMSSHLSAPLGLGMVVHRWPRPELT